MVSKHNTELKTILLQGLSEPKFYDDLVYKFRKKKNKKKKKKKKQKKKKKKKQNNNNKKQKQKTNGFCLFVLRFYGPVKPMGLCRARSVYLTTHLLGRLGLLRG